MQQKIPLSQFITPQLVICQSSDIHSKRQVLQKISELIHQVDERLQYHEILHSLMQREKLGSTAIGHGIAIPHARISNLLQPLCSVLTLKNAVQFDDDKQKNQVDIIFGLVVPAKQDQMHLDLLADLSQCLMQEAFRQQLRGATTQSELINILVKYHM